MLKFATSAGFYFYMSLEDQRLMRVRHLASSTMDENDGLHEVGFASNECRLASRGSFIYDEYEICTGENRVQQIGQGGQNE